MQQDAASKTDPGQRYPENPANHINLAKYPLNRLGSPEGARLIALCHKRLARTGVCHLKQFLNPAGLEVMVEEAHAAAPGAHFRRGTHNAYMEPDDGAWPADHPRRLAMESSVASVPYDHLAPDSALRALYEWNPLVSFMGAVFGDQKLYRLVDHLGALSINIFRDGDRQGWHFSDSEYTTTLMLQSAEAGGEFEYVPGTGSANNEADYAVISRILRDEHNEVRRVPFAPGDLLVFAGSAAIHRVTEVRGSTPRMVAVLCFSTRTNAVHSDEVRRLYWGRVQ
ncbi:MAG: hypothetical protein R3174_10165 [Gammaproteobacteria bacterium]|nr:hypothetical protein [Gammaproteobacteria bacterium]